MGGGPASLLPLQAQWTAHIHGARATPRCASWRLAQISTGYKPPRDCCVRHAESGGAAGKPARSAPIAESLPGGGQFRRSAALCPRGHRCGVHARYEPKEGPGRPSLREM